MQAESPITEFASHMEPTVELPTGESVSVQSIIDQIVEASRTTMDGDKTTVEMLLHPEGAGKGLDGSDRGKWSGQGSYLHTE